MNLEVGEMPSANDFECLDCEETFTAKEFLQKHQNEVCQKYKCNQCESTFPIFKLLEEHALVHSKDTSAIGTLKRLKQELMEKAAIYNCLICDKQFSLIEFLINHQKKKCLKFQCNQCKKPFVSQTQLESHKCFHEKLELKNENSMTFTEQPVNKKIKLSNDEK